MFITNLHGAHTYSENNIRKTQNANWTILLGNNNECTHTHQANYVKVAYAYADKKCRLQYKMFSNNDCQAGFHHTQIADDHRSRLVEDRPRSVLLKRKADWK